MKKKYIIMNPQPKYYKDLHGFGASSRDLKIKKFYVNFF